MEEYADLMPLCNCVYRKRRKAYLRFNLTYAVHVQYYVKQDTKVSSFESNENTQRQEVGHIA